MARITNYSRHLAATGTTVTGIEDALDRQPGAPRPRRPRPRAGRGHREEEHPPVRDHPEEGPPQGADALLPADGGVHARPASRSWRPSRSSPRRPATRSSRRHWPRWRTRCGRARPSPARPSSTPRPSRRYYLGILRSAELTGQPRHRARPAGRLHRAGPRSPAQDQLGAHVPGIVFVMAIVAVVIITGYVLPKFKTFFDSPRTPSCLCRRGCCSASRTSSTHDWFLFVGVDSWPSSLGGISGIATRPGRAKLDAMLLRVPRARRSDARRHPRALLPNPQLHGRRRRPAARGHAVTGDATTNAVYREGLHRSGRR